MSTPGVASPAPPARHATAGRLVAVTGRLQHRTWTAADGSPGHRWYIVATDLEYLDPPAATAPAGPVLENTVA